MKKIATLVKGNLEGFTGHASVYECNPPLDGHQYVVASATNVLGSWPETYLFPSNETGQIIDWGELDGSYQGGLDHAQAFKNAGYEINTENK